MKKINIFFVHKGYQPYLKVSIFHAKKSNPEANIFLLGDETNKFLATQFTINHFFINDYFNQADEFEKIYKHVSQNNFYFEMFCFQRWFVLEEFIKKENVDGLILYNDSDTLMFCNFLNLYNTELKAYDFSVCSVVGPQFSFFRNRDVLISFCSHMIETYSDPIKFNRIFTEYQNDIRGKGSQIKLIFGSISDMTLLGQYYLKNIERGVDLEFFSKEKIFEENHYFGGKKYHLRFPMGNKIFWKNTVPYYKTLNNKYVQILGFHLQGSSKREIAIISKDLFNILTTKEFIKCKISYINFLRGSYFKKIKKRLIK